MERQQILATMGELRLYGMKAAFDAVIKVAVKRSHEPRAHRHDHRHHARCAPASTRAGGRLRPLVLDRARLLLGDLGLKEVADDLLQGFGMPGKKLRPRFSI